MMDAMEWNASTFHKIHTEHVCGVGPEVLPGLFLSMKSNREVYIRGRGRLRVRDFLNTLY